MRTPHGKGAGPQIKISEKILAFYYELVSDVVASLRLQLNRKKDMPCLELESSLV
jgi:hypothetical protein